MAQNLKIVLDNVEKQTPNNVGFSDTITIKGDSKVALTSFNASFDINKQGQDILDQSFIMNLNEKAYNSPREVEIPDRTYYHNLELDLELIRATNKVFSAYEKDAPNPRVFTGYTIIVGRTSTTSLDDGYRGDDANKTSITCSVVKLSPFVFSDYLLANGFTINDSDDFKGAIETLDENLDLDIYMNGTTHIQGGEQLIENKLDTDTQYLNRGGGACFQYNERFNLKNLTLNSRVTMYDSNGNTMRLKYDTEERAGQNAPTLYFEVEKFEGGVVTKEAVTNDFYSWNTSINDNQQKPTTGPWSQTQKAAQDSYFLWCVRDGKWIIVFYDANGDGSWHDVYTNGIAYNIEDNYSFRTYIQQASQKQVIINSDKIFATLNDSKTGSTPFKTTFNFENAPRLREIYSFGIVFNLVPENSYKALYIPNGPTDFYPSQDFEIACEIDTIKIKNYVGSKGNKNSGRKNIIAYFTPETSISQSSFIYRFDPSSPIYLAVDSKQDIDFNSMNIRFINTYTNKTFSADTITCVITNV